MVEKEEHILKSVFNSALQYTCEELAGLRKRLHEARVMHDYELLYDLLRSYHTALSAKMTNKMLKMNEDMFKEVMVVLDKFRDAKRHQKKFDEKSLLIFQEWEMQLRRHEDKLGLLTPESSDPGLALASAHY